MRQSRKGKRSKTKSQELRLKSQICFHLSVFTLSTQADANICAKNACLRATHRQTVIENKDSNILSLIFVSRDS